MECTNDLLELRISVNDAEKYTKMSKEKYIKMIQEGYFPISDELLGEIPENGSEEYEKFIHKELIIPLSYLPEEANVKALTQILAHSDITSIDFFGLPCKVWHTKRTRTDEAIICNERNHRKNRSKIL